MAQDEEMQAKLKRRSFRIDVKELRRARLALDAETDSDAVRGALSAFAGMRALRRVFRLALSHRPSLAIRRLPRRRLKAPKRANPDHRRIKSLAHCRH
jgi:hypothetical protein